MDNMVLQKLGPVAPGPQGKEGAKSHKDMVDPNRLSCGRAASPPLFCTCDRRRGRWKSSKRSRR